MNMNGQNPIRLGINLVLPLRHDQAKLQKLQLKKAYLLKKSRRDNNKRRAALVVDLRHIQGHGRDHLHRFTFVVRQRMMVGWNESCNAHRDPCHHYIDRDKH